MGQPDVSGALGVVSRLQLRKEADGSDCCHDLTGAKRAIYAVLSPVIPFLFTLRGWKMASSRGRSGRFLAALPIFFLLQCFWALGECVGYVTGRP